MAHESAREILDKALKRKEELDLESEALSNLIEVYRKLLNVSEIATLHEEDQPDLYRGSSQRSAHAAYVADMMETARRIIIAEKRPMKRGELARRLKAQGYEIIGKDKNKVLGTNIWRSQKFETIPSKGYWPHGVELPD